MVSKSLRCRAMAVALVGSTLLAACGSGDDSSTDRGDDTPDGVEVVKADLVRSGAPADAPVDQLVAGMRAFAVELAAADDGAENLVMSPASIAAAFAMAEAGAGSATAADIAEVFGFPTQPEVHEAMNALTAKVEEANHPGNGDDSKGVTVDLANAVWGQRDRDYGKRFLDTLAREYGLGVNTVDFAKDPEAARQAINAWVADITHDRIKELLAKGTVDPSTVVALVNAIYLKAAWTTQFDKDATRDEPFKLGSGSTVNVPTMHDGMMNADAVVGDGYRAAKLTYDGDELSMILVLPDEGTSLRDFEAGMTGDELGSIVEGLQPAEIDISLPRFEATSALDLAEPLRSLGLEIPGGDLSGITADAVLGQAVHAANITVDEEGTEAAAATAVIGVTSAPPAQEIIPFKVDRPFLFLIQHEETGAPLFYGRITDPRG